MTAELPHTLRVVRTKRRRTASIQVQGQQVDVIVPRSMSEAEVRKLIDRKSLWIQKALHREALMPVYRPKEYNSGEIFSYLGHSYPLHVEEGGVQPPKLSSGRLSVSVAKGLSERERKHSIHGQLQSWYLQQAEEQLGAASRRYAAQLGVQYRSISIKQYKSRWGSCSVDGDIAYNWKIIIAPQHIVDYLVVHELSHIRHHDHSAHFWNCVASVLPDYQECRNWLRLNGRLLRID